MRAHQRPCVARSVGPAVAVAVVLAAMPMTAARAAGGFVPDSSAVEHPVEGADLAAWGLWKIPPEEQLRESLAELLGRSEADVIADIASAHPQDKKDKRLRTLESGAFNLGRLYQMTKDEAHARRAVVILVGLADMYTKHEQGGLHYLAALAYDYTYNAAAWQELAAGGDENARGRVETWLRRGLVGRYHSAKMDTRRLRFGNLTPYSMRRALCIGLVLNDPHIVHYELRAIDEMLTTDQYFYADGMWEEGTHSYASQTVGNITAAIDMLGKFADPEGYEDALLGVKLDGTSVRDWYRIIDRANRCLDAFRYPDGRPAPVHDTHWAKPGPIERVANIELFDFGHFALARGTTEDAMQVHLHWCPISGGWGHPHADQLSMILWAAGTDILPDGGYPTKPPNHRYYHMSARAHNMPVIGDAPECEGEDHGKLGTWGGVWTRSGFIAYDPGDVSGKRVQLVEASALGPTNAQVDVRRRLVLLIAIDERRSYVVDIARLRGGLTHEMYLHQTEEEDCVMACSVDLTQTGGTLAQHLGEEAPGYERYRELVRDAQIGDGSRPWQLAWEGVETGATVRCFLNGQPETEVCLGRTPRVRPTGNDPAKKDDFPGWYLERRRVVRPDATTIFGAVYDAWRADGRPRVDAVEWLDVRPADALTTAVTVRIGEREDTIYVSDDVQERRVEGGMFGGRVAVVSRMGGKARWAYLLGAGKVEVDDIRLTGSEDCTGPITGVSRDHEAGTGTLDVAAALPEGEALKGVWLRVIRGDRSGNGHRIERVERIEGGSRVHVDGEPGFDLTERGIQRVFFPRIAIAGQPRVEVCAPAFVEAGEAG